MRNKILIAFFLFFSLPLLAQAYTSTGPYYQQQCNTGAQSVGTQGIIYTENGLDCVAYCATQGTGSNATCCTANHKYVWDGEMGEYVYQRTNCNAKNATTLSGSSNTITNQYEAYLISYAAAQPDLTAGSVTPTSATVGTAVTVSATVSNTGAGSTGAGFTNLFQRATDASGTNATDIGTHTATVLASGGSGVATLSYTFPSAATWYVRVCADKSSAASTGSITESNEGNNCGAWTAVVASAASVPTVTLSASPSSISSGQTSTLTWSSTNATSCTGTGFSTGNQTSGSEPVTPTADTTYSITCTGAGGTSQASNATVTVSTTQTTNTTTQTSKVCSGGTFAGTASYASDSCVSYCTGLNASCCTTRTTYFEDTGESSYTCSAYTGSQSTVTNNGSSNCQWLSGEPYNCSYTSWSATLINYGPAVTASLVANPTSISSGQEALITWGSSNATTCTGTNFSTGGAPSGSVTVTPSLTTTYSLSCTGAGGTATDSETLTVNLFTVTCSPSPSPVTVNQPVSWTSAATGGTGSYSYSWSGTDSLSGSNSSVSKTYSSLGEKTATLSVTSGSETISTVCTGSPCQQESCTCTGAGCGVIVQEGISADISASIPSITAGSVVPGGSLTFSASIQNIGNNSISRVFSNRFQIDVGNDGTYDVALDTGGGTNSTFTLEYGNTCNSGSIVNTVSTQVYGAGSLTDTITSLCEEFATAGQCCAAAVDTEYQGGGGGGDGTGGGDANLVERAAARSVAALYKSLAMTVYNVDITVYSNPTTSACGGGTCYAGTWQGQTGTQYDIPYDTWYGVTSPEWTNIPGGTHKVRMCSDIPSEQLTEANENNNCGPDYTFTVSGFDLTAGLSGINSGQLVAGQNITFFGTVLNTPSTYAESGQCQATVVVTSGSACSLALSQDQIQWSTTGATMVNGIEPLTTSPTIPATGSGGLIITPYEDYYNPPAVAADMLANGGITLVSSGHGFYSGTSATPDRLCYLIDGTTSSAYSYTQTSFNSPGNNYIYKWESPIWKKYGASSYNNKLRYTLKCQKPGSPYALSGSYTFPSPLGPGTHTYLLTSNACSGSGSATYQYEETDITDFACAPGGGVSPEVASGVYSAIPDCATSDPTGLSCTGSCKVNTVVGCSVNTKIYACAQAGVCTSACTASIVIPENANSTLCAITATPSIISSGQSSTLSWTLNGASSLSCNQNLGELTTNGGQSCLPAGGEVPAGYLCSEGGTQTLEWGECCSGTARIRCPAPNEPAEAFCWGGGPGESNEVTVSPSTTTTYQCTATTDPTVFEFDGCAPSEFQIDLGNNGTWDTMLAAPGCVSALGVSQSTQVVSPVWAAVSGTHAVRVCANTPLTEAEGITDNNCGPEYVFTISNPTQCQDGVDNNGNNLIDTADPACSSVGDSTEEAYSASSLSITTNKTTVQKGGSVTLTWSAADVVADSCVITSSTGGTFAVSGNSGTVPASQITGETTYMLSCTSMQTGAPVEVRTTVKLAPYFEEL